MTMALSLYLLHNSVSKIAPKVIKKVLLKGGAFIIVGMDSRLTIQPNLRH